MIDEVEFAEKFILNNVNFIFEDDCLFFRNKEDVFCICFNCVGEFDFLRENGERKNFKYSSDALNYIDKYLEENLEEN